MDSFTVDMLVQAIKSNDEKAPCVLARITQNQIADTLLPWERCILVRSLGGRKCLVSGSIPATVVGEGTRLPLLNLILVRRGNIALTVFRWPLVTNPVFVAVLKRKRVLSSTLFG